MRTDKTGKHQLKVGDCVRWDDDGRLHTISRFIPHEGSRGTYGIAFVDEGLSDGTIGGVLPDETTVTKVLN